jgi:hypothetical protein
VKRIAALGLLSLPLAARAQPPASPTALPEARPLAVDVKVDPEQITLGQRISVRLSIDHDARDVYTLPAFDPAPLAVPQGAPQPAEHREELQQGKARTVFDLELADFGTLDPKLPAFTLHVTGPEGERVLHVRGRPLQFKSLVAEEKQGAPDAAHHGPKPPVEIKVRSYLWAAVLGVLLAGVALGYAFWLWNKRRKIKLVVVEPPTPFDEVALQKLARLRREKPWQRATIFQLSEIVRGYLGERLRFNALDLTSEEFLQELHHRRLMGLDLNELTDEVRWEDLVKFAKVEPEQAEVQRALDRAESLIRHTRPQRAVPAPTTPKEAA